MARTIVDSRIIGGGTGVLSSKSGTPDTNRTCDPLLRRQLLYPLSYGGVGLYFSRFWCDSEMITPRELPEYDQAIIFRFSTDSQKWAFAYTNPRWGESEVIPQAV